MPAVLAFAKWLEQTPVGASVRQSLWLFPAIETIHLLGMSALLASIAILDLRLMGVLRRGEKVSDVAGRVLPWAWTAFAVQVLTGGLLFSSEAVHMVRNPAFRLKLMLILLAGVHALVFQLAARKRMLGWERAALPAWARLAGAVSLLLWIGVVAAGRWIGFI